MKIIILGSKREIDAAVPQIENNSYLDSQVPPDEIVPIYLVGNKEEGEFYSENKSSDYVIRQNPTDWFHLDRKLKQEMKNEDSVLIIPYFPENKKSSTGPLYSHGAQLSISKNLNNPSFTHILTTPRMASDLETMADTPEVKFFKDFEGIARVLYETKTQKEAIPIRKLEYNLA